MYNCIFNNLFKNCKQTFIERKNIKRKSRVIDYIYCYLFGRRLHKLCIFLEKDKNKSLISMSTNHPLFMYSLLNHTNSTLTFCPMKFHKSFNKLN